MAKPSKLRVMISSRCDDKFPVNPAGRPLSDIRKELKTEIEAIEVCGRKIFEVWINEETPRKAAPGIAGTYAFRRLRIATSSLLYQTATRDGRKVAAKLGYVMRN